LSNFIRRLFSFPLIQLLLEVAGFLVILLLLSPLFSLLPHSYYSNLLSNWLVTLLLIGWFLVAGLFLEGQSVTEIGLSGRTALRDLLLGFGLGGVMMTAIIGVLALAGWYRVTGVESVTAVALPLLAAFLIFCAAALQEEIVFRGMIFRLLEKVAGSWIALILSALIFGLSHLTTPHATLIGALAIAATGGIVSASIYMLTRNIWGVFGLHWAWNFFEGPIFGTAVSGHNTPVLFHSVTSGPALWTGGSFGPEAGLVTVLIGCAVALVLLIFVVRRRCVLIPGWLRRIQPTPSNS